MKITPRTAEAAAPTGSGTASTLSGSTCVMAFNSGTADRLITVQTGKFGSVMKVKLIKISLG